MFAREKKNDDVLKGDAAYIPEIAYKRKENYEDKKIR